MKRMKIVLVSLMLLFCSVAALNASEGNETEVEMGDEVESFEEAEKNLKANVGYVLKKLLPYLLKGGADVNVSGPCTSSIMKIIGGVRQLKEWAMRFVDATGKLPPGILEGTSFAVGDYDECLDIEVGKKDDPPRTPEEVIFRGQYCLLENHRPQSLQRAVHEYQNGNKDTPIARTRTFLNMLVRYKHLSHSTFKWGVCVPSKCTKEDIENILRSESLRSAGRITVSNCDTYEEKEISVEQLLLLCIIGFFVGLILLGTAFDIYFRCLRKEDKEKSEPLTYARMIVKSTSLYSNALNVLNTANNHEPLSCLRGIRTITVIFIIYGHTYGHLHVLHFQKFSKAANLIRFCENFFFAGITNGSLGIDTVSFMAAVTITYNGWRFMPDSGKANPPIFKIFLQRYCRMSAAQLLSICIFLLFPLFGSGPLWHAYTDGPLEKCRTRWWLNILYIGNFWKTTEICLYHTWVLALIMQLTVLGLVVIWILNKSRRYGIFSIIIIIMAGIIGVGVMTFINDLPGGLVLYMHNIKTFPIAWGDIYILPYDHMGPFCIGLLVGYFLAIKKTRLEISKITSTTLWCLFIACNAAVMFGLYGYRHGEKMDLSLSTFYAVMHRNVWALGIGWLVIACTTHHGGPVSRVLNSNIFVTLDRLCYMAYMLHIPIMFYHSGVLRDRWYMGHLELFFMGIAYVVLSFLSAFVVHIIFASPYYAIEEHVCSFFNTKNKVSFESKCDTKTIVPSNCSVLTMEDTGKKSSCVSTSYSKTHENL